MKQGYGWLLLGVVLISGCGVSDPFSRGRASDRDGIINPTSPNAATLDRAYFDANLKGLFANKCSGCHDNPAESYDAALTRVAIGHPERSDLFLRATGQAAGHYEVFARGSREREALETWIASARVPTATAPVAVSAPAAAAPLPAPATTTLEPPSAGQLMYEATMKPLFENSCARCHHNPAATYEAARAGISPGKPAESALWLRASGRLRHPARWRDGSSELAALESWINAEK